MREYHNEDKERVKTALELADFGKRLKTLPHGIETVLTKEFDEEGINL